MFFLLFIFIHMMPIFAVCQNDLFLKVMKLYDNEKYADARSILEMIEPKNSFVLYNVGNCYYGEDNQVEALYYWYQAFRYGTAKEKLLIAQRICQVHSRMSVPAHDDSKHGSFCSFVFLCPSLLLWQILLLFVWILLLYVLFYMRSSVALCLLISMSACFMCCTVYYAYYLRLPALFITKQAPLYVGPDSRYHQCGMVNASSCYIPLSQIPGWSRIRVNGRAGWISDDCYKCLT